ncbi:hypothetical protein [Streptomyces sp. NPDC054804]
MTPDSASVSCGNAPAYRAFTHTAGVTDVSHTCRRTSGSVRHSPSPVCVSSTAAAVAAASGSSAVHRRRAAYASTAAPARPPVQTAIAAGCHHTGTQVSVIENAGFRYRPDPSCAAAVTPSPTYPAVASSGAASREGTSRPTA